MPPKAKSSSTAVNGAFSRTSRTASSAASSISSGKATAPSQKAPSSAPKGADLSPQAENLYAQLQREFQQPTGTNVEVVGKLLVQLKIALADTGLLLPSSRTTYTSPAALLKARNVLEIGALHSIRTRNISAFERYIAQLQPYWRDYAALLKPSERRWPLVGLNLLRLLSQNKISQFHSVLEALVKESGVQGVDLLHDNPYVSHPVNLEQWLMEGRYSKVWSARTKVPTEEYRYFVDVLMDTIRNEIASCEEKAYATLPLQDAGTLLFFSNRSETLQFAQKRGWQVDPRSGAIIFPAASRAAGLSAAEAQAEASARGRADKERVVGVTLGYARELEAIV